VTTRDKAFAASRVTLAVNRFRKAANAALEVVENDDKCVTQVGVIAMSTVITEAANVADAAEKLAEMVISE
jgi:hypothetical protein